VTGLECPGRRFAGNEFAVVSGEALTEAVCRIAFVRANTGKLLSCA